MKFSLRIGRYCLRLLGRDRIVPVRWIRRLRRLCYGHDPLFPETSTLEETGAALRNPFLAGLLCEVPMGTWSLSARTLNFLEQEISTVRPHAILEFGSGISTTCLARYMFDIHGTQRDTPFVISIEQDPAVVIETRRLLSRAGLDIAVQLFHAPLGRISGRSCYTLDEPARAAIRAARPDFVVIDGPAAEDGARYTTLPSVQDLLASRALFYMDDALRDGEMNIADKWARLHCVGIKGMYLTEKGLLLGEVRLDSAWKDSSIGDHLIAR